MRSMGPWPAFTIQPMDPAVRCSHVRWVPLEPVVCIRKKNLPQNAGQKKTPG